MFFKKRQWLNEHEWNISQSSDHGPSFDQDSNGNAAAAVLCVNAGKAKPRARQWVTAPQQLSKDDNHTWHEHHGSHILDPIHHKNVTNLMYINQVMCLALICFVTIILTCHGRMNTKDLRAANEDKNKTVVANMDLDIWERGDKKKYLHVTVHFEISIKSLKDNYRF